jgi:hypothetical protein
MNFTKEQIAEMSNWDFNYYMRPQDLKERKSFIEANGLPCKVQLQLLPALPGKTYRLWALVITPLVGFVHLVHDNFLQRCYEEVGAYHISICFNIETDHEHVAAALERWGDEQDILIPVKFNSCCAYIEGGEILACPIITSMRHFATYEKRGLHISM